MKRFLVAATLALVHNLGWAHEDRILRITDDGEIVGIPEQYGKVRIRIDYSDKHDVRGVYLSGRNFGIRLNNCVLEHLTGIVDLRASGSWYHDLGVMPPYVSLDFVQERPAKGSPNGQVVGITFSLSDGRILTAHQYYDPW